MSTVAACGCSMMRTDHALRVLCYGKDCGFCAMGRTAGSVLWEGLRVLCYGKDCAFAGDVTGSIGAAVLS